MRAPRNPCWSRNEAYDAVGMLPGATIIKLEFCTGDLLFGLSPDEVGLNAWFRLFDADILPWMVTLRDGNVNDELTELALQRGGHVRVGEVEQTQEAVEFVAADLRVDGAAVRVRVLEAERRPALLRVECAADCQQGVAHLLGVEAA